MAKGFWNALTGGTSQGFNQAFGRGWEAEEAREYQRLVQDDIRNIANAQKMYESITPEESNIQQPALEQNIQVPTMANQMQKRGYRDLSQQAEPTQSLLAGMKPLDAGEEIVRQADRRVGKTLSGLLEGMASMKTEVGRQLYQQWLMTEKKTPEQLTDGDRDLIPLLSEAYSKGDNKAYSTYYPLMSSFGQAHWDKLKSGLVRDDKPKDFGIGTMITVEQARQIADKQGIPLEVPEGTTHVNLEYEDNSKRVKSLKPVAVSSGGGGGGNKPTPSDVYITKNSAERIRKYGYMTDFDKNIVRRVDGSGGYAFGMDGVDKYDNYPDLVGSGKFKAIQKNSGVPKELLADAILKQGITGGAYVISYDKAGASVTLIPKRLYENYEQVKNGMIQEAKNNFVRIAIASGKASQKQAEAYLNSKIGNLKPKRQATATAIGEKYDAIKGKYDPMAGILTEEYNTIPDNPASIYEELREDFNNGVISEAELSLLIEILYYETGFLPETAKIVSSNINTEG